jgi:hypothetical protein
MRLTGERAGEIKRESPNSHFPSLTFNLVSAFRFVSAGFPLRFEWGLELPGKQRKEFAGGNGW